MQKKKAITASVSHDTFSLGCVHSKFHKIEELIHAIGKFCYSNYIMINNKTFIKLTLNKSQRNRLYLVTLADLIIISE